MVSVLVHDRMRFGLPPGASSVALLIGKWLLLNPARNPTKHLFELSVITHLPHNNYHNQQLVRWQGRRNRYDNSISNSSPLIVANFMRSWKGLALDLFWQLNWLESISSGRCADMTVGGVTQVQARICLIPIKSDGDPSRSVVAHCRNLRCEWLKEAPLGFQFFDKDKIVWLIALDGCK